VERIFTVTAADWVENVHWIEENCEVPKGKTKMESGEFICSTKEGEKFGRRYLVGIGCGIGNVKVQRNNISTFVLDTLIGVVGKVERGQDRHRLQRK